MESLARSLGRAGTTALPFVIIFIVLSVVVGCSLVPGGPGRSISSKLAAVGLVQVAPDQAGIPPQQRGESVPVRVRAGATTTALPPDPAGYLLVGVAGGASGRAAVLEALASWRDGRSIRLRVQRNTYLPTDSSWWEADVLFRLPVQ